MRKNIFSANSDLSQLVEINRLEPACQPVYYICSMQEYVDLLLAEIDAAPHTKQADKVRRCNTARACIAVPIKIATLASCMTTVFRSCWDTRGKCFSAN